MERIHLEGRRVKKTIVSIMNDAEILTFLYCFGHKIIEDQSRRPPSVADARERVAALKKK